jgi:hypothetical protein
MLKVFNLYKQNLLIASITLSMGLIYLSCVEPINISIQTDKIILVVDGNINDTDINQKIVLKKTIPSNNYAAFVAEKEAKVTILENNNKSILTTESDPGVYNLPQNFKAIIGNTYQLKITLKSGVLYQSEVETMRKTPEIKKVYSTFDKKGITRGINKLPGHNLYLDFQDLPEKGDNYFWSFKHYERQQYCKTCEESLFFRDNKPEGRCISQPNLVGITYDYLCETDCWDIFYNEDINVMSDIYSNGNEIKGRLVAKIPFYQRKGCVIEITQQNVSQNYFRYLKLLANQSQNNGTLVDSPPAALIGNIANVADKFESVGGYFSVGSSKSFKFWLERQDVIDIQEIGLLGRMPNLEVSTLPNRPPSAVCIKSQFRTPLKPEGWRD